MRNFTFVLILIWSLTDFSNAYCSSQKKCVCSPYRGGVMANCVGLGIRNEDDLFFDSNVINIDLGSNFLKNIPHKLPSNVQILNLTDNPIKTITKNSLAHYTKVKHLVISYCKIKQVRLGAFQKLVQLHTLDISNNQGLTMFVITNISRDLQFSAIKSLNFEKVQCRFGISKYLTKEHTKYLQNTSLEELNVAGNKISVIDTNVFELLPKTLKYLNIADNSFSFGYYLFTVQFLTNVRVINASFQDSFHQTFDLLYSCNDDHRMQIDKKCRRKTVQIESNKERLVTSRFATYKSYAGETHLQNTSTNMSITLFLPPKLEKLYLSNCMYKVAVSGFQIRSRAVPKITHVHLQNNIYYQWKGPVFDFTNVQYLDLSNNFCSEVSGDFFNNVDDIKELNLSHNILGTSIENDVSGNIFKGFTTLQKFDMSYNRILELPRTIFHNMKNTEQLNLSNNKLEIFNINFSHMRHLSFLDLSYNRISIINKDTRTAINGISKRNYMRINLLGNTLRCTCKEIDFIRWLHNPTNINFMFISRYQCIYSNSSIVSLENLDIILHSLEKSCPSYTVLTVLTTSAIVISLTCAVCGVIYRYRWSLRYWYYVAKRDNNRVPASGVGYAQYKYHAFISYAQGDVDFVLNQIVPFEKQNRFRFLIHDRDFIPGVQIADNITNAVHCSKRTICIVTPHFLRSQWCKFELNMARMESIYSRRGENTLMLIILDKNIVKDMPRDMIDIVETESYLEYPNETGRTTNAFWNKFSYVINS